MSDYIPDDLLFKVLERLPVKSLIRCSSVCKSWYSIIRSPSFIAQHLNRVNSPDQIVKNEKIVFTASGGEKIGFYSLNTDNSCHNHLKLDCSSSGALYIADLVSCCSGLVCLHLISKKDIEANRVVIWNPCIRNVEIYRQHTGAWSVINSEVPYFFSLSGATVNGVVHWLVADKSFGGQNSILLFNMHTEAFSKMAVPPSIAHSSSFSLELTFSSESLVLYDKCHEDGYQSRYSTIWVMKEYGVSESWTKLFNIDLPGGWHTPLGLRRNGEFLYTTSAEKSLLCYDPVTNRTTTIAIDGTARSPADTYVESLLLLDVNGASEHESFGEFLHESLVAK